MGIFFRETHLLQWIAAIYSSVGWDDEGGLFVLHSSISFVYDSYIIAPSRKYHLGGLHVYTNIVMEYF